MEIRYYTSDFFPPRAVKFESHSTRTGRHSAREGALPLQLCKDGMYSNPEKRNHSIPVQARYFASLRGSLPPHLFNFPCVSQ